MSIAAGTISLLSVSSNGANLSITAASGGTGPYTNQWYRSTTTGFSPGGGNILAGQTGLSLVDSGLIPGVQYFYKVIQTDTGHSNDTATATQVAATTTAPSLNITSFQQQPFLGMLDLKVGGTNVIGGQIDVSQSGSLYAGQAVKIVNSPDGVPKVIACAADTDEVFGFIVYDIKSAAYVAGSRCELAQAGSCMWLYATTAIVRGAQVSLISAQPGSVSALVSTARIVGYAYDQAAAYGQLIRVYLKNPSFAVAP